MESTCLECYNTFEFEVEMLMEEGVEIHFAECPHCFTRYLTHVVDKEVQEGLDKAKRLYREMNDRKHAFHKRQKYSRKHRRVVQENRRLMGQKKAEYAHLVERIIRHGN